MEYIKISQSDNVAVALTDLEAGTYVYGVKAAENIGRGHKIALLDIAAGDDIIKYGSPIGHATVDIKAGQWVHTHNVATNLDGILEYSYTPVGCGQMQPERNEQAEKTYGTAESTPVSAGRSPAKSAAAFKGFRRRNGVGVRNEIWIIPTVGCVNSIAEAVAKQAGKYISGSVSGVYAFTHPYGCSQIGDDHKNTQKALAGLVRHPNAGGVLVIGLGCENNNIGEFKKTLGDYDCARVKFINCQDEDDEIEAGVKAVKELIEAAAGDRREDCPVSELTIGLKCGGSDGLSGITANPVTGAFADKIIEAGGSAILTEVPEMFGAEQGLMDRCENREVFDKTVNLINDFKKYFMRYNQVVYENPSPGNKAGGITTLEDKSLGCTQKCGSSPVRDVIGYGDKVTRKGLTLLSAPGNDLVASTSLAIAGAQIVLFTTGRGTPFGCPVPTVKIASNSALAQKKKNWIDFDAGVVCESGDIKGRGRELYDYVLMLASGDVLTKNEDAGMREIAIFKDGVTL